MQMGGNFQYRLQLLLFSTQLVSILQKVLDCQWVLNICFGNLWVFKKLAKFFRNPAPNRYLFVFDYTKSLNTSVFTKRHALLVEIFGSNKRKSFFTIWKLTIELRKIIEFACTISNTHNLLAQVETLRYQATEFIRSEWFGNGYLFDLRLEF